MSRAENDTADRVLTLPAPGGRAVFYLPQPPLSGLVQSIWLYEAAAPAHARERVLPSGTMQLTINLREDRLQVSDRVDSGRSMMFPGSLISGAYARPFVIDAVHQSSIMGVAFRPGGAFPFFDSPADDFRDEHVSLDTLWGAAASDLREQLLEAATPGARLHILAQALLARATKPLTRRPAVAFALKAFRGGVPAGTVGDVTEQVGLSPRRFIQLFSEEVGLTPKLFCRIQRFQKALRAAHRREEIDWAEVAAACGYFDQSHLIHDFRAFTDVSPSAYLSQRGEHLNHLPLPD